MAQTFCLTIGDPTGIGPEITVRLLQDLAFCSLFNLKILGNIPQLHETALRMDLRLPVSDELSGGQFDYIHVEGNSPGSVAYSALEQAVQMIRNGLADVLVTGPISKENLRLAGLPFEGHTEILQHLAREFYGLPEKGTCHGDGPYQSDMLFVHEKFRVLLLTRHVPLAEVSQRLNVSDVCHSLANTVGFLRRHAGIRSPRLCMMGVNPHAGEIGGQEERTIIMPAIERISRQYGVEIEPPRAADALFRDFDPIDPPFDCYVAAYHDQGLIPMKLIGGYKAVNITIGLPFLRTSVSHGMAADIVGRGTANPASLREALEVARQFGERALPAQSR